MPALSQDRELDQLLQQVKPEGRYLDLGILFRRLSIEADVPIPDDTYLTAGDGTRLRVRNTPGGLVCGSNPPGASRQLSDGTELAGIGGLRGVLRIETVASFGGRWDSLTGSYCQPAAEDGPLQLLVFDLQESQVAFCRWFAGWWADFVAEQPREHSAAVVVDDRGGGKTLICLMLLIAAVLDRPKHADGAEIVAWAIIRSHSEREEVDREIRTWLPEHYYHLVTSPKPCLKLANGATIWLRSADDPEFFDNDPVLIDLLCQAVRSGKEVTALVELKARFDEEANINWSERLETVGAQVVYGVVGLKTHAKILLVTRREGRRLKRYGHLSTGNYNPRTARLYTDLGHFTADDALDRKSVV